MSSWGTWNPADGDIPSSENSCPTDLSTAVSWKLEVLANSNIKRILKYLKTVYIICVFWQFEEVYNFYIQNITCERNKNILKIFN